MDKTKFVLFVFSEHRERDYERTGDNWRAVAPNSTVMVSNLPVHVSENEVSLNLFIPNIFSH